MPTGARGFGLAGTRWGNGANTKAERFQKLSKCKEFASTAMPVETVAQNKARVEQISEFKEIKRRWDTVTTRVPVICDSGNQTANHGELLTPPKCFICMITDCVNIQLIWKVIASTWEKRKCLKLYELKKQQLCDKNQCLTPDLQGGSPPPMNAPPKLKYSTDLFALCVPGSHPTTDLFLTVSSQAFFPEMHKMWEWAVYCNLWNKNIITALQGSFAGSDGKFTLNFS